MESGETIGIAKVAGFTVERTLGVGAGGVVYRAFDEKNARWVALKVVAPHPTKLEELRFHREVRALSKIVHPNVVAAYENGDFRGRLYLAMEYLQGQTLSEWQQATERTWAEVLAVYLAAGQGLAAAHEAGFIHRDFKPSNVLVCDDGRVKLLDFGLATRGPEEESDISSRLRPVSLTSSSDFASPLYVSGSAAYMPPEQFRSGDVDETADQFAFCASLWEALYGSRPFGGGSASEMFLAVSGGKIVDPKDERGVPAAIRRALERGLSTRPAQRWPTMRALLEELRPSTSRKVVAWTLCAIGTAAVLAAAAVAMAGG